MIKLYGFPQTRATRVAWALEEAHLEYEYIKVNLRTGEHRQPEYAGINPHNKLPALVDGDLTLVESAAILTYLGEKYPKSGLVPPVEKTRARAEYLQWLFFLMTELEQPLWTMFKHSFAFPEDKRVPAVLKVAEWEFARPAAVLAQHLANREFIAGYHFTAADIAAAMILQWAQNSGVALGHERLTRYMEMHLAREALERVNAREAAL